MAAAASKVTQKQKSTSGSDKVALSGTIGEKYQLVQVTTDDDDVSDVKDVKASVPPSASTVKKLMGRGVGRSLGIKPMRARIPYSFQMSSSVTGLVNSVLAVTADANTTEWAAFQTLYDEYRVLGGEVKFFIQAQTPPASALAPSVDNAFVMVWDPVDAAALTGVRNGCEATYHTLIVPQATSAGTNSNAIVMSYGHANGKPYVLRWKTSGVKDLAITSGAIVQSPGQWKNLNSAGNNNADGTLKVYTQTDYAAVTGCVIGIHYVDLEFRVRK